MNPSTESSLLLEETNDKSVNSINDDYAAQRQRRQICLNDPTRRRTCEGSAAEVEKLLKEELEVADKNKIIKNGSSDFTLHRLRGMFIGVFLEGAIVMDAM
uniref:Uncharacterized protein n=1 Tax=Panagrolaimus sp. PS1159 TaxID=55785 RepID=A0AC35GR39_9BILA